MVVLGSSVKGSGIQLTDYLDVSLRDLHHARIQGRILAYTARRLPHLELSCQVASVAGRPI